MRKFVCYTLYARKVLQVEEEQKVCVVDNICVNIAHTLSLLYYCDRALSHKNILGQNKTETFLNNYNA